MEKNVEQIIGKISSVKGQIVTVDCMSSYRPALREMLVSPQNSATKLEVHSYKSEHELFCLLLSARDGVHRGMDISTTGGQMTVPVGKGVLGRVIDLYGEPQDGMGELEDVSSEPIYTVKKEDIVVGKRSNKVNKEQKKAGTGDIIQTGIKAIDFFAPLPRGAKMGLVGGAGVGKTILMTEILRNINSAGNCVSVFAGIGERVREGHELWQTLKTTEVLYRTALIFGGMNENAAVRFKIAWAAATIVEYFRDVEKQDVLFFVDNIFRFVQAGSELSTLLGEIPSEFGYQPTLQTEIAQFESRLSSMSGASVTSIQTVYVPADVLTNPSVVATIPHLASVVILSRTIAHQGRHPSIDLFRSRSAVLERDFVGDDHYDAVVKSIEVLNHYERLSRIAAIIGEEELSAQDQKVFQRAQKLLNYMTQPFFTAEQQTGRAGVFVERSETVKDVLDIVAGKYDDIPATKFLYIGTVQDAKLVKK